MRIQVLKKGTRKPQINATCPWIVDIPPETDKK